MIRDVARIVFNSLVIIESRNKSGGWVDLKIDML